MLLVKVLLKELLKCKLTAHLMPDNTQEPCNVLGCADNDVGQMQWTHHSHHAVQRFLVKHITSTAPIYIIMNMDN